MSRWFPGLRSLLIPLVFTICALLAFHYFQSSLQSYSLIITQLPFWLLGTSLLLAAQFNRSRISLLSLLLLLYYASTYNLVPNSGALLFGETEFLLFGMFSLALLSIIRDRRLLSPYGLQRLLLLACCAMVAYAWVWASRQWIVPYLQSYWPALTASLLIRDIPIVVAGVVMLGRVFLRPDRLQALFVITALVLLGNWFYPQQLPLSPGLLLLSLLYIACILVDSYFLAYRDELTALPSRRALNQLALSLGRRYTVAMLDIDHFKKFNDTYGHDIGDQVLKLVATKLAGITGGGRVFRYGGEEFTVVFPRKAIDSALPHLETVRQAVADYQIVIRAPGRKQKNGTHRQGGLKNDQATVSVTISIGVAARMPKQSFEQVIKAADQALYRAKKRGRNQVCS